MEAKIRHNKKLYCGGYFDNEERAAMSINLLCDKIEIEHKNPNVRIEPNAIQQVIRPLHTGIVHKKVKKKNTFFHWRDSKSFFVRNVRSYSKIKKNIQFMVKFL